MDTKTDTEQLLREPPPRWIAILYGSFVAYVITGTLWIATGFGGPEVTHYVALVSDIPAALATAVLLGATARYTAPGPMRRAWQVLGGALALYSIGVTIGATSWLRGHDPFPGPADAFYCAFYLASTVGALYLIRAAAVRVPWVQLSLDATIFVVGFGAFFWFLVIRPAATASEVDFLRQALSEAYAALDCILLLMLGVTLLAGSGSVAGRRVPLLLLGGYAIMFMADVLWSLAKVRGYYLPGQFQDVLYLCCYAPMAAASREQLRNRAPVTKAASQASDVLARSLPHAAMLAAFLVLVYFSRGDIGGPATVMTMVVFALTLLLMVRQGVVLRGDAVIRERKAARIVEDRYASLIANASDVIMIVAPDGVVRFVSPSSERTLGLVSEAVIGNSLPELWRGEDGERLKQFLAEVAATSAGTVGPVELRIERDMKRCVVEGVGSNLMDDPAVQGLALNFRDISERKALEEQLRQLAFHDPLTLLANRNLFRDRVQHALALAQRAQNLVAVMFLDLDNFKNINDSLGHDAGDRLLQAVAQRIMKTTRSADTVARLGGDEFCDPARRRQDGDGGGTPGGRADRHARHAVCAERHGGARRCQYRRRVLDPQRQRRDAAEQRRHRDVPRKGGRQESSRHLPGTDAGHAARAPAAGGGYQPRAGARGVLPRVPADRRPEQPLSAGGRGAGALAASAAGRAAAGPLHPDGGGVRPDRQTRSLGAAPGLP